jgi:hypothetical protein
MNPSPAAAERRKRSDLPELLKHILADIDHYERRRGFWERKLATADPHASYYATLIRRRQLVLDILDMLYAAARKVNRNLR